MQCVARVCSSVSGRTSTESEVSSANCDGFCLNPGAPGPMLYQAATPSISAANASRAPLRGVHMSNKITRGQMLGALAAVPLSQVPSAASAKTGQLGKIGVFGLEDMSSPYMPGMIVEKDGNNTQGYAKSNGDFLGKEAVNATARELASFKEQEAVIRSLGPTVEAKTWWLVKANLRAKNVYEMRDNMLALNSKAKNPTAAKTAYKKFWTEVESLDYACAMKDPTKAKKEYSDVIASLDAWNAVAM